MCQLPEYCPRCAGLFRSITQSPGEKGISTLGSFSFIRFFVGWLKQEKVSRQIVFESSIYPYEEA